MSKPIILWRANAETATDDACTTIIKSTLPPVPPRGDYESSIPVARTNAVPSLTYYVIKQLVDYPDQVNCLGSRRLLAGGRSSATYNALRALIPGFDPEQPDRTFDLRQVDPRLWAVLTQVYSDLPAYLRTYEIPLSDPHIPLLQTIPATPDYTAITVLELPGCKELADDTIANLKALHALCALDASSTQLSAYGIMSLAGTLVADAGFSISPGRGPWGLRVLLLRKCKRMDHTVYSYLNSFPLLAVVDLRGTSCSGRRSLLPDLFQTCTDQVLCSLCSPFSILDHLSSPALFPHPNPHILHVNSLHHRRAASASRPLVSVTPQDTFVVMSSVSNKLKVGNAEVMHEQARRLDDEMKREANAQAKYERIVYMEGRKASDYCGESGCNCSESSDLSDYPDFAWLDEVGPPPESDPGMGTPPITSRYLPANRRHTPLSTAENERNSGPAPSFRDSRPPLRPPRRTAVNTDQHPNSAASTLRPRSEALARPPRELAVPTSTFYNNARPQPRPSLPSASSLPPWAGAPTEGVLLYRDPPTYSILDSIRAEAASRASNKGKRKLAVEDGVQRVDRGARAKEVMGIWGMVDKRRKTENRVARTVSDATPMGGSKNPFRRKEPPMPAPVFASGKDLEDRSRNGTSASISTCAVDDEIEDADSMLLDPSPAAPPRQPDPTDEEPAGDKRLRRISTLSIPVLPSHLIRPGSTTESFARRTSPEPKALSQAKLDFKENLASSNASDKPKALRPSSSFGNVKSAKAKDMPKAGGTRTRIPSDNKARPTLSKGFFDLKSWARK
ncbi:hypothetical protein PUNSTDRAFT_136063 [Punctularia strigosozonata HHB-11173 SS5]|uniref:uncharacterized protein n=1 Tax=Punctularia strigosozonata (strain HHB-11173) TaxID=741275 RepID=UPI00044182DA|nr:uncharacterized protein PUNSTDRAFT_136063 [Punctularia strigosozonata HHB-11173 SS5]EIN07380.1 hypothetical protein PUNSTDRAFT_136063 [Punctularia strigosozonata HHB-11173 SS5]